MLDVFAERLARHVDAGEHFITGLAPGGDTTFEHAHIPVAERDRGFGCALRVVAFACVGEEMSDWLELAPVSPVYRTYFPDGSQLDMHSDVGEMYRASRHLRGLVEDILDMARILIFLWGSGSLTQLGVNFLEVLYRCAKSGGQLPQQVNLPLQLAL